MSARRRHELAGLRSDDSRGIDPSSSLFVGDSVMLASRRFVPSSVPALEGRVVPSHLIANAGGIAAELRPVRLQSAELAQSNASEHSFSQSVSNAIHNGQPVTEQVTTKYSDGSTQAQLVVRMPNPANNTVTTYKTVSLRNNGGTETVVGTESFSGGTTPFSGVDNTHAVTITLPNGSTESETYQDVITGNTTNETGSIDEANGGVETWTSVIVRHGPKTTTNKTITEPNGTVEQQKIVTTRHGKLDSTATTTTRTPSTNSIVYSSSATNVIRSEPLTITS
jgi:hypothetical protein